MLVGDGKPGAWCWGICFWENIGGIWGQRDSGAILILE